MSKRDTEARGRAQGGEESNSGCGEGAEPIAAVQSGVEKEAGSPASERGPSIAEAPAAEAAAGEAESVATLGARIGALEAAIEEKSRLLLERENAVAELSDKYMRALAESENSRRRLRQQSEETVRRERENLLRALLPVVDNLERAVDAARGGGNGKSIVEGVEMVLGSLLDFLKQQGVTPQTAVGQMFDPARHEAIDHVPSEAHPPNTVVQEAHRGYQIGERVLRPARVIVARGVGGVSQPERKDGEAES